MKPIVDFEGYFATEDGNIYSEKSNKILSTFVDNVGYKQVILYKEGKRCYKRLHRLIAITLIPNPENKPMVNHKSGNKLNCEKSNLEWSSNSENTQHAYDTGLYSSRGSIKIKSIDKITGESRIHSSIRECAVNLKVDRKTLSSIIHRNKSNHYNYTFEIVDNNNVETIENYKSTRANSGVENKVYFYVQEI